jgi:hypothetical protein
MGDDDGGSGLRERACGGKTHAGAATGHQGNLSSEVEGGVHELDSFPSGVVGDQINGRWATKDPESGADPADL